jgi:hypothetical protein
VMKAAVTRRPRWRVACARNGENVPVTVMPADNRSRGVVLDLAGVGDAARGVENLSRKQVAMLVVVEDHAGLVLPPLQETRR